MVNMLKPVLNTVSPIQTAIRSIFVMFDVAIYSLLQFMYELFFNVATVNLLDRQLIFDVFTRVQLVIGIFMMFQLVMIIIKGIVNPDSFTDSKSGAGTIIMRIIVSLALLALIVPINITSPKNEYEKQINNNGILFGTLYSLQYRILSNNTFGKLILGDDSTNYTSNNYKALDLRRYANRFTSTIVKSFYQLNTDEDGNYVCNDGFDKTYNSTDEIEPGVIIMNATEACGSGNFILDTASHALDPMQISKNGSQYRLTMNWLSTIVGIVLIVVFFMLIFNVATRVFKLAGLQLIAPIPIISYMDPKGSKDGAFSAWVKMLASTYLELFVQLAVIYFSFAVINKFIEKFLSVENGAKVLGNALAGDPLTSIELMRWTFIVMTIALFIFAKNAPKFFRQMLGIKSEKKFFDAFGQALGVAAVGQGVVSSAIAGANSKYQNTKGDKGKKIGAAILGGLAGGAERGVSAGRDFFTSKDGNFRGIMDGNRKNAARLYSNAADDSTFKGRMLAGLQSNLGLQNEYEKLQNQVKYYEEAAAAPGRIGQAFDGNGAYKTSMITSTTVDDNGNVVNIVDRVRGALTSKGYSPDQISKYINGDGDILDASGNIVLNHATKYTLKDMNDIFTRIQASGDATLITAVDEAKKAAQGDRLDLLRTMSREDIEALVNDPNEKEWCVSDLNAYDAAMREYKIAEKYIDEPEFAPFKDPATGKIRAFNDPKLGWGKAFKFSGGRTKEGAETIKHSPRMDKAAANAKRAEESAKKK